MVMNNRHVALLIFAAFVAGGAIVLAVVLIVTSQTNLVRLAAQRDTLVQQTDKLVAAVQTTAANQGQAESRLSLASQQGRDAEDELRATINDLRDRLAQGDPALPGTPAEQLAACRRALAEQLVAAQSYVTALNIANERVASLSNALAETGQRERGLAIKQETEQKYAEALDAADARIASLGQALQLAGNPAPVIIIPSDVTPPPAPSPFVGVAYSGPLPYPYFGLASQRHGRIIPGLRRGPVPSARRSGF
jgi:hypothetical protein